MVERQGYDHAQRWMYKDVRLALLWRSFVVDFPNADWVIVRRDKNEFIQACLNAPRMAAISDKAKFWNQFFDEYNHRLDMLKNRADFVHEVHFEHIQEGDLSALKTVSDSIGIQFETLNAGTISDRRHWHHS